MKLADKETGWETDSIESSIKLLNGERVECKIYPDSRLGHDVLYFQMRNNDTIEYSTNTSFSASSGRFQKGGLLFSLMKDDIFCSLDYGNVNVYTFDDITTFNFNNGKMKITFTQDNGKKLLIGEIISANLQQGGPYSEIVKVQFSNQNTISVKRSYASFDDPHDILSGRQNANTAKNVKVYTLYRGQMVRV